ncbi:hypothetical protein [Nitratiruptor tergarcus]|nr:hypothetical protein [Nitratiruptor tergarcus]
MKLNEDGTIAWQKGYKAVPGAYLLSIIKTDGGYVAAGDIISDPPSGWIIKINEDGSIAWQKTYWDGFYFYSIIKTDNGYIAAGYSSGPGYSSGDGWIMKINEDGTIAWQKRYGGNKKDKINSIIKTDDGYIAAGYTESFGAGKSDAWIIKLNGDGSIAWQKRFGGDEDDFINSIIKTDDGYVAAGYTESFGAGEDYDAWITKLNEDGDIVWQYRYGGDKKDRINSIIKTDDGYIGAGVIDSTMVESGDAWIMKINEDGDIIWQKRYGEDNKDEINSIIKTDDGYVAAGGTVSFGAGNMDGFVLNLDQDGDVNGCEIIKTSNAARYPTTAQTNNIVQDPVDFDVNHVSDSDATISDLDVNIYTICKSVATVAVPLLGPFGYLVLITLLGFFGYRRSR